VATLAHAFYMEKSFLNFPFKKTRLAFNLYNIKYASQRKLCVGLISSAVRILNQIELKWKFSLAIEM